MRRAYFATMLGTACVCLILSIACFVLAWLAYPN